MTQNQLAFFDQTKRQSWSVKAEIEKLMQQIKQKKRYLLPLYLMVMVEDSKKDGSKEMNSKTLNETTVSLSRMITLVCDF